MDSFYYKATMKTYDNILSESVFELLSEKVMGFEFDWHWSAITYPFGRLNTDNPNPFNLTHYPIANGRPCTQFGEFLEPILYDAIDRTGDRIKEIYRVRVVNQPRTFGQYTNDPHIDLPWPHNVGIIYLNDTNSPTVIYKEKFPFDTDQSKWDDFPQASFGYFKDNFLGYETVVERVIPKRNRLLTFDGGHYHASATPDDVDRRVIINFTYSIR